MEYPLVIKSESEQDTINIAGEFIKNLKPGDVINLMGELGSGKTFFIKQALAKFGIDNVNSPSFAIVNEYSNKYKFYHFDFYRLKNVEELFDIGWQDYLNNNQAIIFVEWGDLFLNILPPQRIDVNIKVINNLREFEIDKYE